MTALVSMVYAASQPSVVMSRGLFRMGSRATPPLYGAFISYSRSADAPLARVLQRGLERFARPWYRRRAIRVFRDDATLTAGPALWAAVQSGIDQSEFLVVLCSPASAASAWVDQEVRYWLTSHPADRVLLALTEGDLVWDAQTSGYDPHLSIALPPALLGAFAEEPRHVDLRPLRDHPNRLRRRAAEELL